jgi:hypothetical protein
MISRLAQLADSAEDAETERLRALVGAIVGGLPRGFKIADAEQQKIDKEVRERGRARINALLHAVAVALVSYEPEYGPPRPLSRTHLEQLARILARLLDECAGTKHKAGRPERDHRLLAVDFLLRRQASPKTALKKLHADVAADWSTTEGNVKKLVAKNRRSALALLEKVGSEKAARTVRHATKSLRRYRNPP